VDWLRRWILSWDWRLRWPVTTLVIAAVLLWAIRAAGLWPQPAAVASAAIVSTVVSSLLFRSIRRWFDRMDWRVAAIFLATLLAVAATLIVIAVGLWRDPATFMGATFAGWVSGVALFAIVGLVVAVVSLARPEEESVESRARILFRGQKGRHIDYIVARIRQVFEQYAEDTTQILTVNEYHPGDRKFLVVSEGETRIRSYIDDTATTYRSHISLDGVTGPPQGRDPNRLLYLRVGQQTYGGQDIAGDTINLPFDTIIAEDADCLIADGMEFWVNARTEPNSFSPVRFSQRIRLTVRNHIRGGMPLRLSVSLDEGRTIDETVLRSGESRLICDVSDIEPNKEVYDVRLLAP
jgi:hypothetical protein